MIPCSSQVNPLLHIGLRIFRLCNHRLLRSLHLRSVHNGGDIMFRNLLALLIAGQPVATHRLTHFPPVQSQIATLSTLSFCSQRRWYHVSQPACPAHRRSTRCYTSAYAFKTVPLSIEIYKYEIL